MLCKICEANELLVQNNLITTPVRHTDAHDEALATLQLHEKISNDQLSPEQAALVLYALVTLENTKQQWQEFQQSHKFTLFANFVEAVGSQPDLFTKLAQAIVKLVSQD